MKDAIKSFRNYSLIAGRVTVNFPTKEIYYVSRRIKTKGCGLKTGGFKLVGKVDMLVEVEIVDLTFSAHVKDEIEFNNSIIVIKFHVPQRSKVKII